jgi:hypothetical protein
MFRTLVLSTIAALALQAGLPVKVKDISRRSLPEAAYGLLAKDEVKGMTPRSRFSLLWADSTFSLKDRFKLATLKNIAPKQDTGFMAELREQLRNNSDDESPLALTLTVTDYQDDTVDLEGRFTDTKTGKAVCYFVTSVCSEGKGRIAAFMAELEFLTLNAEVLRDQN